MHQIAKVVQIYGTDNNLAPIGKMKLLSQMHKVNSESLELQTNGGNPLFILK